MIVYINSPVLFLYIMGNKYMLIIIIIIIIIIMTVYEK